MKKQTLEYIELSDLVPESWRDWFYGLISEDAPFSWGDNNRTLVTALRLHDHVYDRIDVAIEDGVITQEDADKFLKMVEELKQTYIDLEN